MPKTIAIIGAGLAGLIAAKEALAQGLIPTIFEKQSKLGGAWNFETGSVWKSLRTNVSCHTCTFSDFPWPFKPEIFPTQLEITAYLLAYAQKFDLLKLIRFETQVTAVRAKESSWSIEISSHAEVQTSEFDNLIVATGIFSKKFIPDLPGHAEFKAETLHAAEYKTAERFIGKNVLVIGGSYSGSEIAVDLAKAGIKVTQVVDQASWILPRFMPAGEGTLPLDLLFYKRSSHAKSAGLDSKAANKRKHSYFASILGDQSDLKLTMDPVSEDPVFVTISDTYADLILTRSIEVKRGRVIGFTEDQVCLSEGSKTKYDSVIFATGYRTELSFLPPELLAEIEYEPTDALQPLLLYQACLPKVSRNIAFVGMCRGPYFGVAELQARIAARMFAGKLSLEESAVEAGLEAERSIRYCRPRSQFPHGDYLGFSDSLATLLGVCPDFRKLQEENQALYTLLWDYPMIPAHYRLYGEGAESEIALQLIKQARDAGSLPATPSIVATVMRGAAVAVTECNDSSLRP